jgi:hypothetical protein
MFLGGVLQLWYQLSDQERPMGDQNSLLFSLWNGSTRKVIGRGSGVATWETFGNSDLVPNPKLYSALARQIVKKLNELP